MTVPSSVAKSGPYICNGVTDVFNYDFRIVDKSHLNVILTDANGAETSLTLTTHYTVSDVGSDAGSINLTAAGVALAVTGTTLTILRNPPFTQETDLQNQGAYLAQTVEDRFDLLTMQIQTVKERSDRSIAVPASDEDTTLDDLTADLVKVAGIAADVSTVADNNANVTTAADNIDAIIAAPTEAANAASSASAASASAGAAATSETNAATSASEAAASAASVNPDNLVHKAATDASSFGFVLDEDDMASDSAQKVPTQQSVNQGKLQKVATRTAMKALDGSKHLAVYLMEAGREGTFKWDGSDLSAKVTIDTAEGIYVAPSSDTTGASGAWVRQAGWYVTRGVNVEWFGAPLNGSDDDTPSILAAATLLDAISHGGTIWIPPATPVLIDSTLTLPQRITLDCSQTVYSGTRLPENRSIKVNGAATINLAASCRIRNMSFERKGLVHGDTSANIEANWVGTCITLLDGNADFILENLGVFGFNVGIRSVAGATNVSRVRLDRINIDCKTGVILDNSYDTTYLREVHCWPFCTTQSVAETGDRQNYRSGKGISLRVVSDWSKLDSCFTYGYSQGFYMSDVDQVTLVSCSADHTPSAASDGSIGFAVDGDSKDVKFVGCQTAAKQSAWYIATTSTIGTVQLVGCNSWAFDQYGVNIVSGNVQIIGGAMRQDSLVTGTTGVNVTSGAGDVAVLGMNFTNLAAGIAAASGKFPVLDDNTFSGCTTEISGNHLNTFTPVLEGLTTTGAGTYTVQSGRYQRKGKLIAFQLDIRWSAHTGTGNMRVSGLPFANGALSVAANVNASNLTFTGQLLGSIPALTAAIDLQVIASGAANTGVSMDTSGILLISGSYLMA